jgi:lipopolysaccharide export system permease protein
MLFDATLRRELARSFSATLVVLLTVVITMMLVRTLSLAASDLIEPKDVLLVLGYTALAYLPTIVSVAVFASIVVTLARMYRDSEMVIWFAAGLPLTRFVRPVLRTFWPVLLAVGALQLGVWPWVNRESAEVRERYAQRSDLSRITPGVFLSTSDGRRVVFVERADADTLQARNVFVLANAKGVESVVSARAGGGDQTRGERVLVLHGGQRSDLDRRSGQATLARFDEYRMLVAPDAQRRAQTQAPKTVPTLDLIRQPTPAHRGELVWRIGLFAAAVNLTLLAVGLAHVNLRRPSNRNLISALLGCVVYFNLVNLTQTWVAGGRLGTGAALAGLHLTVFVLALLLLWWRDHASVTAMPWRRRPAGAA